MHYTPTFFKNNVAKKTHKMRGVWNEVRGRLKVLISLSFIAESQSICLKLNMDLIFFLNLAFLFF